MARRSRRRQVGRRLGIATADAAGLAGDAAPSVEDLHDPGRDPQYDPAGERVLIGSTTQLTTLGMSRYIEQIEAYGASELGVRFTTRKLLA